MSEWTDTSTGRSLLPCSEMEWEERTAPLPLTEGQAAAHAALIAWANTSEEVKN